MENKPQKVIHKITTNVKAMESQEKCPHIISNKLISVYKLETAVSLNPKSEHKLPFPSHILNHIHRTGWILKGHISENSAHMGNCLQINFSNFQDR